MHNYLILFRFTDKGVAEIGDSPARVDRAREIVQKHGGAVKEFFALSGRYDTMFIVEAPDEEAAATMALSIAACGNVRTEVARAFTEVEFANIAAAAARHR